MLQAREVSLERGSLKIFIDLNFTVHPGQRVGIVGRNGAGKSSLFTLILRKLLPNVGDILYPKGWQLAHMSQEPEPSNRSALEYVMDGDAALRRIEAAIEKTDGSADPMRLAELHGEYGDVGGYEAEARAGEILYGLGFTAEDFTKPQKAFSGGWRVRLALAKALMSPSDLLLLDEPTNHLDLDTTLWLENWLNRFPGTLMIIAHDRVFLDNVIDHTLHLHHEQGDLYRGNYSSFEAQRVAAIEQQQATFEKQQAKVAHVQKFVDRFRAQATKAKQVQSRVKALEKMQLTAPLQAESPYQFEFTNPRQVSTPLLNMRGITLGYDGSPVLDKVNLQVLPGDRIGILGVNGAGKSTLLKAVSEELNPMAGEITRGKHSKLGYFAQHQLELLNSTQTALENLQRAFDLSEQEGRNYLGSWGFSGEATERPISTLSGGEKARLVLGLIAKSEPAILVLDEPTNHLDLDMREALAMALQSFNGALLLVSHDRSLLDRSVDQLWVVRDGSVTDLAGSVSDYGEDKAGGTDLLALNRSSTKPSASNDGASSKQRRKAAAQQRRELKPLREAVRKLEKQMEQQAAKLKAVELQLADPEIYERLPKEELDPLLKAAGELRQELEATESEWLQRTDEYDSANNEEV